MSATGDNAPMSAPRRLLVWDDLTVWAVALGSFTVHMAVAGRYGFHRDEFYYIACGFHPAWGYVDHPALVPMLARFAVMLFGASVVGLRLFAALAATAVIVLTGYLARELGGGKFAASLAALAVAVAPIFVSGGHLFQTVPFDQLVWALALTLLALILRTRAGKLWLPLGATLGVGVHTKSTVIALALGIAAGLLLTRERTWLRTPWSWLGAFIAFALALPNIRWQAMNGWPTLEFSRNSGTAYWHNRPPVLFALLQPALLGIGGFALACLGLWWLFRAREGAWRPFGWLFIAAFIVLLAARGKEYYPAPAYLPLFAAGAVAIEEMARRHGARLRRFTMGAVIALALPGLPLVLPVLPVHTMLDLKLEMIMPDLAEQIGWPEFVGAVAGAYQTLPPDEQAHALVLAANWGEAGAVDLLGARYDLPAAISGQDTYYLWGSGDPDATTYVAVGFPYDRLARYFDEVIQVGKITNRAGVPNEEAGRPIFICRRPKQPLRDVWPEFKRYV